MSEYIKFPYNAVVEAFADHVAQNPGKLFVVEGKKEFTYADTFRYAYGFSKYLTELGVKAGDCVVVKTAQTASTVICDMAIGLINAIYVPLEKVVAADRVSFIIGNTDSNLLISDKEMEVSVPQIKLKSVYDYAFECDDAACAEIARDYFKNNRPDPDATGELLYTTGTTGVSKGVELSNLATVQACESIINCIGMKDDEIEVIPVPINHAFGIRRIYTNILMNGTIIILDGFVFVDRIWNAIDKYNATGFSIVPSALSLIFKLTGDKLGEYNGKLRYLQMSTSAQSVPDKEKLCQLLPDVKVLNFYGCSEAGIACYSEYNRQKDKLHSIGRPTPTSVTKLLLEDGTYVDYPTTGVQGRLCYTGAMNMKGYWKDPEKSAEALTNGYVVTNDLAYFDEEGYVFMMGRADDVINSAGAKIAPAEIEEVMEGFPGIAECAVVGVPDEIAGEVPKMFVVLQDGAEFDPKAINSHILSKLEGFKAPKYIVTIDAIPRTYNGKILRRELKKM